MPMSLLLGLVACAPPADTGDAPAVVEEGSMAWSVEPPDLAFGEVPFGESPSAELRLTNTGSTELSVFALQPGAPELSAPLPAERFLAPGATVPIAVQWSPQGVETLQAELQLSLSGIEGLRTVAVPVSGAVWGPVAALEVADEVIDATELGCATRTTATVANTGSAELHVAALGFDGASGFAVDLGDTPPPWTLGPGESRTVDVEFAPYTAGQVLAQLTLESDDPVQPSLGVALTGTALDGTRVQDEWTVPASENVTALFAVNEVVQSVYREQWQDGLEVLFTELLASGVPFRVGVVCGQTGEVSGDVPYIDESFDVDDAVDAAVAMVPCSGIDNDYLLSTLEAAIPVNEDWLLDESEDWAGAKLNLVGINSDQEQSAGNATLFVNHYRAYKEDTADIAVHGIGGDVPTGCPGAEPFAPFQDAATLTDGAFLSICDSDWTHNMETLAAAFMGEGQVSFPLSELPAEWSLEVWLDGSRVSTGWSYAAESNRLTFDADAYPAEGAELRVRYLTAVECPA